jgi:hypothetical protein
MMTGHTAYADSDPRHHTDKIKGMLREAMEHAREDVGKVSDPKAQALFETSAEVLRGLDHRLRALRTEKRAGLALNPADRMAAVGSVCRAASP